MKETPGILSRTSRISIHKTSAIGCGCNPLWGVHSEFGGGSVLFEDSDAAGARLRFCCDRVVLVGCVGGRWGGCIGSSSVFPRVPTKRNICETPQRWSPFPHDSSFNVIRYSIRIRTRWGSTLSTSRVLSFDRPHRNLGVLRRSNP